MTLAECERQYPVGCVVLVKLRPRHHRPGDQPEWARGVVLKHCIRWGNRARVRLDGRPEERYVRFCDLKRPSGPPTFQPVFPGM